MWATKYKAGAVRLVLLLALSMLLGGCTGRMENTSTSEYMSTTGAKEVTYRTAESYIGDFVVSFEYTTRLTSLRITNLFWEYSGDKYVSINVRQGDLVAAGDVLAVIEPNVSEADVMQKELNITQASIQVQDLNETYGSIIAEMEKGLEGLSGRELELANAHLEKTREEYGEKYSMALQRLVEAQRALARLEEHKATTEIIAPYDGYVAEVIWGWQEGSTVSTSQPLIVLADVSALAFRVTNTSPYGHVPYLSQVELVDQKDQKSYAGTVVSGADLTGSASDELIVIPEIPENLIGKALMGSVKVKGDVLHKENVVLVDSNVLYKDGDNYYVLILGEGNAVGKTYVTVGAISAGVAWITEGLSAGVTLVLG